MHLIHSLALLSAGYISLTQAAPACGTTTEKIVDWKIERFANPGSDGKMMNYLGVNGKWPADAITLPKCTRLVLRVDNECAEEVSLHFHGILQSGGQSIQDGAQGLSQSGILDSKQFTYNILLDKPGTYWIHSHTPSQYPKGIRAPLIVTDTTADEGAYGYTGEQTISLSDWWPSFYEAHDRSLSTSSDPNTGTCGNPTQTNKNGYGIEYPARRVTYNDVYGYANDTLTDSNRITTLDNCDAKKRLRFINMSSHARFYIWFSDQRSFDVIELDGIYYTATSAKFVEVSSGQRVSIAVGARDSTAAKTCKSTYIIAASDPKVAHGTDRCKMVFTRGDRGVQFTHGYLNVNGQTPAASKQILNDSPPSAELQATVNWMKAFALDPADANTQYYPSGSWEKTTDRLMNNRMKLPYETYFFSTTNKNDYDNTSSSGRSSTAVLGLGAAQDLNMVPKVPDLLWDLDDSKKSTNLHFITLGITKDTELPGRGGFAAMAESAVKNKLLPWKTPDEQPTGPIDRTKPPRFPSVFRALEKDIPTAELNKPERYQNSAEANANGRTMVFPDESTHWLVFTSDIGDHPMHLHGHHFQILAKLPGGWFDPNDANGLITKVRGLQGKLGGPKGTSPPKRDTMMVEKGLTYVIAVQADNPGVWALHCHNDIHAVSGMFSQIVERPEALRTALGNWKSTPGAGGDGDGAKDINFVWTQGNGQQGVIGNDLGTPAKIAERVKQNFLTALERYYWNTTRVGWS